MPFIGDPRNPLHLRNKLKLQAWLCSARLVVRSYNNFCGNLWHSGCSRHNFQSLSHCSNAKKFHLIKLSPLAALNNLITFSRIFFHKSFGLQLFTSLSILHFAQNNPNNELKYVCSFNLLKMIQCLGFREFYSHCNFTSQFHFQVSYRTTLNKLLSRPLNL